MKRLKKWLSPFVLHPIFRYLLVHYYYRDIIRSSERVFQLRRRADSLGEPFWENELRKQAHIIDKGPHRCDWETGNSAEAYLVFKKALLKIQSAELLDDPSIRWAKNKVAEYENRTTYNVIDPEYISTSCSYDHLLDVIKTRRSIRRLKKQKISRETVRKIVEVLNWAPGSCHRQTGKVYVTDNPDLAKRCLELCAGSSGFSEHIALFFCFCSDIKAYQMPVEATLPYINVSLGIQNCNLVAHSLGVALTMLSWAQSTGKEEKKMKKLLNIPEEYKIIVNAVGGYPECGAQTPERKSIESTMKIIDELR